MKKVYLLLLIVGGVWWYAAHRFNFSDIMEYAKKNHGASWAPAVEYSVGMVYYQRADYPKAQETFTQLLTEYPTGQYEARALLRLSDAAEENRDWPTAKQTIDQFLTEFPDHPSRQLAEKRKELLFNK
jgi:outer membrane protein assembly factor BamD (BamD/ComL family)